MPGKNPRLKFKSWTCEVVFRQYDTNKRIALDLVAAEDDIDNEIYAGEHIARATINVPDADLAPDEVVIKNYSENEGMLAVLVEAGIVTDTGRTVAIGHVLSPIAKLRITPHGS